MVVFPNAKVNIGLDVLRKRPDGFHDIQTVMVPVDWCDVLEVVPSDSQEDTLHTSGQKIDCAFEKNLVIKPLRLLRSSGQEIPPVDIYLHKNIPDGAGLGGGSADAAFMIKLLNELFALNLNTTELLSLAASIGSDCAFFIENQPALCIGRGEVLIPFPKISEILADKKIVIVKPMDVSVSTAEAYSGVSLNGEATDLRLRIDEGLAYWPKTVTNAFEDTVLKKSGIPQKIKDILYANNAYYASMSGSGSAVFGIFDKTTVLNLDIKNLFPDCKVHIGNFLI